MNAFKRMKPRGSAKTAAPRQKLDYHRIKVRRVFEEVCDQIRAHIANGTLRPGDKLPAERDLAVKFGVGRAAVREALRSLEVAGVVHLRKGVHGGAFIQHLSPTMVSTSLRDLVYLGNVSLEMLTETRSLINTAIVKLVCERATEVELDAIEATIELTEHSSTLPERLAHTRQFYRLLGAATHNPMIMTLVDSITEVLMDFAEKLDAMPMSEVPKQRRRLLRFIRERDVERASKEARAIADELHKFLLAANPRS
jgi:GntR family transcriptional regulator, transcriptional repressor for pyruvate dehydrogenase complex